MRQKALGKEARKEDKAKAATASKKRRTGNYTDNHDNGDDPPTQSALAEEDDQSHLRGGILRPGELKALTNGVDGLDEFKKLGEGVLSPPRTASPDGADIKMQEGDRLKSEKAKVVYTEEEKVRLAEINGNKDALRQRRVALDDREKFLGLVKARAKSVLEELKKSEGIKDICGFDSRLSWVNEEFDIWRLSPEGRTALESGLLGPPSSNLASSSAQTDGDEKMTNGDDEHSSEIGKGVCQKKRCERHKTWYKLQQQEINFEKDECRQQMRKSDQEEKGLVERAMIRHLEYGEENGIDAAPVSNSEDGKAKEDQQEVVIAS